MTAQGVVDAFIRGDLDRRGFITKLTALGVSASAASAYALTLGRQGAAAAPESSTGGIARYQDGAAEEDYGTDFIFETIEEALQLIFDAIGEALAVLSGLGIFSAADFADPAEFDLLGTIQQHQQEHADALAALLGSTGAVGSSEASFDSVEAFLTELAGALDDQTATYAAVVPAIGDGATRQTLMNVASVANRHAAVVHQIAGLDPLPEAFEVPEV
jgi:hypothetical protein